MKICIDPGHGGKDSGAIGANSKEKDINLKLALVLGKTLSENNINVVYTRTKDEYVTLEKRCSIANKNRCDYFISIHCNASKDINESGTETFCLELNGDSAKFAKQLHESINILNNNKDRGIKKGNFYVLRNLNMPACLLEVMFISNIMEEKKMNDEVWQTMFARKIAQTIIKSDGSNIDLNSNSIKATSRTSIMGESLASIDRIEKYVHMKNAQAPYLARLYINIGKEEGVRGDLAFVQAIIETNVFRLEENVNINNYIGILNSDDGKKVCFDTPADGIRAHIQHLKAFASTEKLNSKLIDPTFHIIERGTTPYWEDLDEKWHEPKKDYGEKIVSLWREMLKVIEKNELDVDDILLELIEKGVITNEIDLDKTITLREFLFIAKHLLNK